MKKYVTPYVEEIKYETADVITVSLGEGNGDGNFVGFDEIFPDFEA